MRQHSRLVLVVRHLAVLGEHRSHLAGLGEDRLVDLGEDSHLVGLEGDAHLDPVKKKR